MTLPQLRVKLVVAAGIVGASLLAATFVGCQSGPSGQGQGGPYGQMNNGMAAQQANNMYGGGQPMQYGAANGQMAPMNGMSPQNRQAFMNETQRIGAQQNLTAQDVAAMQRAGVPEQQIAAAIQQRGGALAGTPGAPQYLPQNGVQPTVGIPGQPANGFQTVQADASTPFQPMGGQAAQAVSRGGAPAGYPMAQAEPTQMQPAGYETQPSTSGFETPGPAVNNAVPGQAWRSMSR